MLSCIHPWYSTGQLRSSRAPPLDWFGVQIVGEVKCADIPDVSVLAPAYDGVILFAGHMLDKAGRPKPRFPSSMRSLARREIERTLDLLLERIAGAKLAISSAARGGDILFLEACRARGIPYLICLPYTPDRFLVTSVEGANGDCVERFHRLLESTDAEDIRIMPELEQEGKGVYLRFNRWMIDLATELGRELRLIALWDGREGDAPGGTADLVRQARNLGVDVTHIDTRDLLREMEARTREE